MRPPVSANGPDESEKRLGGGVVGGIVRPAAGPVDANERTLKPFSFLLAYGL
jgi:hypothetical protein